MEYEDPLACSEEPASCPYSETQKLMNTFLLNNSSICFNICVTSKSRSAKSSFSFMFPHQKPLCLSPLYVLHSAHLILNLICEKMHRISEIFVKFGLRFIIYRVSQEERTRLREGVPYVKLYRKPPQTPISKVERFRR